MTPKVVKEMILYAWVGEDETGSGETGLKQGLTPVGLVPLVACKTGKVDQRYLKQQLQEQADESGMPIRLCKFVFAEEICVITPKGST